MAILATPSPGFNYHQGYRKLAEFEEAFVDNHGFAATLIYDFPLTTDIDINLLYEWVNIDYEEGKDDNPTSGIRYQTSSITLSKGFLSIGLSHTEKTLEDSTNRAIYQLNIHYNIAEQAYWSIGVKQQQEPNDTYYFFGIRLKANLDL